MLKVWYYIGKYLLLCLWTCPNCKYHFWDVFIEDKLMVLTSHEIPWGRGGVTSTYIASCHFCDVQRVVCYWLPVHGRVSLVLYDTRRVFPWWTSCIGALPLICEGSANLRVLCWSLPNYRAKEKKTKTKRGHKLTCVPWVWSFFPWSLLLCILLIDNVAFEDKVVSFCNSFLSSTLFWQLN
jgi:hypothetical protein